MIPARARQRAGRLLPVECWVVPIALLMLAGATMAQASSSESRIPGAIQGELTALQETMGKQRFSLRATLHRNVGITRQQASGLVLKANLVATAATCVFSDSVFSNGFEDVP